MIECHDGTREVQGQVEDVDEKIEQHVLLPPLARCQWCSVELFALVNQLETEARDPDVGHSHAEVQQVILEL